MNMNMKVSISGYYYESADNQVDADGFNDNSSKKRESQDKDQKGELERINCTFKEALSKLYENQKFEKAVFKAEGEYKQMIEQLLLQCEVLNDLINGSVIGSQCIILSTQKFQDLKPANILKIYLMFRVNLKPKQDKSKLQNQLDQISSDPPQSDNIDINLQIIDEKELDQFQKRIEVLNQKIGMNQVKSNNNGETFFVRGSELFSGSDKVNEKKDKHDFNLIGQYTLPIQESDPQNIMAHTQLLKIQANLLRNDEEMIQKLNRIYEQQESLNKTEQQQDLSNQVSMIQKKHEFTLNSIDEIPKILSRLISLKQLHQQTIFLPQQLEQTSQQLDWMLQSLDEGSEIISILEKQIK
ncbi:unnamed protein product (macronuclear) [Paramecium tetraurelia]|uniref:Uncharacterized protein n=1 Tax=Paramecium tetraurelia TaxID=5888 RepID=A0BDB3_PARTE|nr:uncharacterized protein GSPATT00004624001 [Paramecium tetraurelia]CAK56530.1 unnamed protein product [Paramecium tetraurelia]|eukprot:XP_001423928.1 hypothetical protein (macronuclear) [Paramecium tetraurelia strain d4-2]